MYTIYYERVVNGTMERTLLYSPTVAGDGYALIDPRLSLQINKAATLRFTMPPGHPCYSIVQPFEGNIKVYDDGERIFYGRVLSTQRDFYKKKQVICEGDLAFLNDVTVPPHTTREGGETVRKYFEFLVDTYNAWLTSEYQDVSRLFDYEYDCYVEGTVNVDSKTYTPVLSEIQNLIKDFGGYLYTSYRIENGNEITVLHYTTTIGTQRDQKIVFGENMLDMTDFITAKDAYSVMIPTGDNVNGVPLTVIGAIDPVTGQEIQNAGIRDPALIRKYGWVEKVINFRGIDDAQTLYNTALRRFEADIKAAQTLTFTAIDLHELNVNTDAFRIGDKNAVVSAPHGFVPDPNTHDLTYYTLTKMELHLADPGRSTYTFGDLRQTLTGGIVNLG